MTGLLEANAPFLDQPHPDDGDYYEDENQGDGGAEQHQFNAATHPEGGVGGAEQSAALVAHLKEDDQHQGH